MGEFRTPGVVVVVVVLLLASGCSWSRQRINVQGFHQKAEQVVPGETRAMELEVIFGTPAARVQELSGGEKMHVYSFGEAKTNGLTLILVNISRTNMGVDSGYFIEDSSGVIREKMISNNSRDLPWEWWAFGE
jgi:hypothetical protein